MSENVQIYIKNQIEILEKIENSNEKRRFSFGGSDSLSSLIDDQKRLFYENNRQKFNDSKVGSLLNKKRSFINPKQIMCALFNQRL